MTHNVKVNISPVGGVLQKKKMSREMLYVESTFFFTKALA